MQEPALLSIALSPRTDADRKNLARGLQKLMAEDPTLRTEDGPSSGEVIVAATGELQLEIVLDRLKREFDVEAGVGRPQVAYKEAFTRSAEGEMKYAKQADGRGHYAHVRIRLHPGEAGSGYVFENRIAGGAIPDEFIPSVEESIRESLTCGVLDGHPVDDVRIELYDGSYHDIDSSEAAFRIAAALAFRDAARKAGPVLLEPVMQVDVSVAEEYVNDVMANLSGRRGRIQSRDNRGWTQTIRAQVPLSEMNAYASDLRSRTRGGGTFVMHFSHYQPVHRPEEGTHGVFVRTPRGPLPKPRSSQVALPEPEDGVGLDRSNE